MSFPKISVIVPVYNVEQYLPRCIDSILSQTFTDFELLLIDDGSTDKSGMICDEYAKKDSRIRVFHKENGGVSSARNLGLDNAEGEWIFFSDADDILELNAFQIFIFKVDSIDTDIVMAGYRVYARNNAINNEINNESDKLLSRNEALKEMYQPTDFPYQGYLWCKLFRSSLIQKHQLRYNEKLYFNEDRLFIVQFLCCSKKSVAYTTRVVYNYICHSSGAMESLKKRYNKKFATDFDAYILMKEVIFNYCDNTRIHQLALKGIMDSYVANHKLMVRFNDYDSTIHKYMFKQMVRTGAIKTYMKRLAGFLFLLFWPSKVVELMNKNQRKK